MSSSIQFQTIYGTNSNEKQWKTATQENERKNVKTKIHRETTTIQHVE